MINYAPNTILAPGLNDWQSIGNMKCRLVKY